MILDRTDLTEAAFVEISYIMCIVILNNCASTFVTGNSKLFASM